MPLPITSIFAALLTFLFIYLCAQVILYRRSKLVSLGDQGDPALLKLMRAQGNFVEYTPLGLILLGLAEIQGAPALLLVILGLMLLAGRGLHAIAFVSEKMIMRFRVLGMLLTFLMLAATALLGLVVGIL